MKKMLVVYYSITGNTRKVAEKIAKRLNADIDEIEELNKRGWNTFWKFLFKKGTKIKYQKDPLKYDLVVIGTPVWARNITPPIREYLTQNKNKIKKIAFFCTCGYSLGKTFSEMGKLSKKPVEVLCINKKELNSPENKIKKFCEKLK